MNGKITFGTDPEFMIVDQQGKLRSAIGIVPGKKQERFDLGGGHRCYYDNVLAECEISPANSAMKAVANIQDCLQRFANLIYPHRLVVQASATYPAEECLHDDAKAFGCDPEFNAYTVRMNRPPRCEEGNTFRSAGGHIHMGYDGGAETGEESEDISNEIALNRIWVARMADIFIGIPSLLMDHDPTSAARRALYGGAGSHRPCLGYGVEYRALSNFWLKGPELVDLTYRLAEFSVSVVMDERKHEKIWEESVKPDDICAAINSGKHENGLALFQETKKLMPEALVTDIQRLAETDDQRDFYEIWEIKPKQA